MPVCGNSPSENILLKFILAKTPCNAAAAKILKKHKFALGSRIPEKALAFVDEAIREGIAFQKKCEMLSVTGPLTGLLNRRKFNVALPRGRDHGYGFDTAKAVEVKWTERLF